MLTLVFLHAASDHSGVDRTDVISLRICAKDPIPLDARTPRSTMSATQRESGAPIRAGQVRVPASVSIMMAATAIPLDKVRSRAQRTLASKALKRGRGNVAVCVTAIGNGAGPHQLKATCVPGLRDFPDTKFRCDDGIEVRMGKRTFTREFKLEASKLVRDVGTIARRHGIWGCIRSVSQVVKDFGGDAEQASLVGGKQRPDDAECRGCARSSPRPRRAGHFKKQPSASSRGTR